MRPTKLGPHVVEAFRKVLASDEDIVLVCTDDDLLYMLNKQLEPAEQISYRSFQRYKAMALESGMDFEYIDPEDITKSFFYEPAYKELYILFRDALIRQKQSLMRRLMAADNYFELRKWQWILERKFREWNIKHTALDAERAQKAESREEKTILNYNEGLEKEDQDFDRVPTIIPVYITHEGGYHIAHKYREYVDRVDIENLPPKYNLHDGPEE